MIPKIPLPSIYPKEQKAKTQIDTRTHISTAALVTIAKRWKQFKYPQMEEWINQMRCIHTMKSFKPKKEGTSEACYNIDEP